MDEGYAGAAVLRSSGVEVAVTVDVAGRVAPFDGRYHWGGRVAPASEVAALVRGGKRAAELESAGGRPAPARLGELDPWGGVRITGVGRPPWAA
jgi:Domain of unknown function (DUF4873)